MAKMIDLRPEYRGEGRVWDALNDYLPDDVIVYNHREINGREFDFCLLIEGVGILIIEVKGWIANKINVQGVDDILVEGYDKPQRSPKKQARAYRFALLNKVKETYNVSPLIFDMVCYPFITKAEYHTTSLDIVSEDQFTIFKEELESSELLIKKIQGAYSFSADIPHVEFSPKLLIKIREDWEPDINETSHLIGDSIGPYSLLSIYPQKLSACEINETIENYFSGIKTIVFVGDEISYKTLLETFNNNFKEYNIQSDSNKLEIGYKNGLKILTYYTKAFNLEIYLYEKLFEIVPEPIIIEEGIVDSTSDEILKQLSNITVFNYQQYVVEHAVTDNNILVEAGAGTGKTYSMVSRIAFLCNKKIGSITNIAEEIAMVTFTNDAANNMKERLKQMFVNYFILTSNPKFLSFIEDVDRAHISTIHSFALSILRMEPLYTGLGTDFNISSNEYLRGTLYDEYFSEFFAEKKENPNFINEIPVPVYDLKKKSMDLADHLLNKSVDMEQIRPSEMGVTANNAVPFFNEIIEKVVIPSEKSYVEKSHTSNCIDLKESIILLNKVLDQLSGKLESLRFKYLFIDEFQDTDDIQIQVFQKLQKAFNSNCRLFIVGDLKQSIYRFRGAKLSAFTQMAEASIFKWGTYQLTVNYRTDHRLLDKYNEIFCKMGEQNYLPCKKNLDQLSSNVEKNIPGEELFLEVKYNGSDGHDFADKFIAVLNEQINKLLTIIKDRGKNNLGQLSIEERTIAILVRYNRQVDDIVSLAKDRGIKIETKSGGDLYQLPSTLDLYKLVQALNNTDNPVCMVDFIESNYTGLKLDYQRYHNLGEKECAADLTRILDEFFMIRFDKTWHEIINEAYTQPILNVLRHIFEALQPWKQYSQNYIQQKQYMANYECLMEKIIKRCRVDALTLNQLEEYLKICIITRQVEPSREISKDDNEIKLICTTVHKSKGLEYGTVILPYANEDISDLQKVKLDANYSNSKLSYTVLFDNKIREFNSNYNQVSEVEEQISEESRILYVALTRAIRNCVWFNNVGSNSNISWAFFMED